MTLGFLLALTFGFAMYVIGIRDGRKRERRKLREELKRMARAAIQKREAKL